MTTDATKSFSSKALIKALTSFNKSSYTYPEVQERFADYYYKQVDPSLNKTKELRSAIRRHQNEIKRYESLQTRDNSKQAKKYYANNIAYHKKQIESIWNNYPEYLI